MASYLTGDSGSFTYSAGETITVANFGRWHARLGRKMFITTPFGYLADRYTPGRLEGTVEVTGWHAPDATPPPVPQAASGTVGTLVLFIQTATVALKYTFKVRMVDLSIGANAIDGSPTQVTYRFVVSADATSDTITPATA